jgi:hypothetical protein
MTREDYLDSAHVMAKRGVQLTHSKLTEDAVRSIRRNPRGWTAKQWADHLGVHYRTIEKVRSHETWSHVR